MVLVQKSAKNLFEAIENKKTIEFSRFLFSLGIRHVGENVAKILARHFLSWSKFVESIAISQKQGKPRIFRSRGY